MSGDELAVFIFCLIASVICWIAWYVRHAAVSPLASTHSDRWLLYAMPAVCGLVLLVILRTFAASDVRDSVAYLLLYAVMGGAWVGLAMLPVPLLGISGRQDVAERRNAAAAYALGGAILGLTLCFAGANVGDGPGWWVVVFCGFLSTATFFLLWFGLETATRISDSVTIDRDRASGLRLAGFLVAAGLLLGRAVAGNWVGVWATVEDFVLSLWPVAILAVAAYVVEASDRPQHRAAARSAWMYGAVPAAVYLGLAAASLAVMGPAS